MQEALLLQTGVWKLHIRAFNRKDAKTTEYSGSATRLSGRSRSVRGTSTNASASDLRQLLGKKLGLGI